MHVTSTGIGVAIALVIGIGFLFFGPRILTPFGTPSVQSAPVEATTTDMTLPADANVSGTAPATAATIQKAPTTNQKPLDMNNLPTDLTFRDEVVGTGAEAKAGTSVTVNYVGALPDGTVFDASAKHGQAFTFNLGAGQVIKGWDQGVAGMKVGGKRVLIVPPSYGYGNQAVGSIPPNSTLIFEVELLSVK